MDASQRKFAKPELAYCMDLRRGAKRIRKSACKSQKCRKFHAYHWLMCFYNNRLLAINLCRLALGGQTVKILRLLASKFELDQSQRKSAMQVHASGWPSEIERKLNASPKLASTCESVWPGLNCYNLKKLYTKFSSSLHMLGRPSTLPNPLHSPKIDSPKKTAQKRKSLYIHSGSNIKNQLAPSTHY